MKKIVALIAIMLISTVAFAELTLEEEASIKKMLVLESKIQKLSDLADTQTNAVVPLEIEKLRTQRGTLIAERDALLTLEDNKCNDAKNVLMATYETQIDAIESSIKAKQAEMIK